MHENSGFKIMLVLYDIKNLNKFRLIDIWQL